MARKPAIIFYILGHFIFACGVSTVFTFNNRTNKSTNSSGQNTDSSGQAQIIEPTVLTSSLVNLESAASSNKQYPKQLPSMVFLKGNLHAHTVLSDGKGTYTQAFSSARTKNYDFYGISDHSDFWLFPFQKDYQKYQSETASAFRSQKFLALWGFEHSTPWLGDLGHFVVHGSSFFRSSSQDLSLSTFYDWLIASSSPTLQVSFAHPGFHWYRFAREFDHFKYEPKLQDVITGIETMHWHGYEVFDKGYGQKMPYIDEAISRGWWLSPHASQDTHDGNFAKTQQFTLVFSKTPMDSQELFLEQIKARHTLASTSESARLLISCNKGQQLMGSKNARAADLAPSRECLIEWDPGAESGFISQITWFSLGSNWNWSEQDVDLLNKEKNILLSLNLRPDQRSYFYIRVTLQDGKVIQSPPIGIDW